MNILISISPTYKFGIDENQILEVLPNPVYTYPENLPGFSSFAVEYKGKKLPVISLAKLTNEEMIEDMESPIIVSEIEPEGVQFGLSGGWIQNIVPAAADQLHDLPLTIKSKMSRKFLWGLLVKKEDLILLINLDELLTAGELRTLIAFYQTDSSA
ncbi:MAG: chemotaxis protein CheW [bacterium]